MKAMDDRLIHPAWIRRTLVGLMGAASLGMSAGAAAAEPERLTAMDVACPWGRLADGRGKLVRCLSPEEAARLREPGAGGSSPRLVPEAPGASGTPVPLAAKVAPLAVSDGARAGAASTTAPDAAKPGWPLPAPSTPRAVSAEPAPPAEPALAPPDGGFTAEVASVVADTGALGDAMKSLRKARDRFAECADKNGGLSADRGEVELRFLVQARGRAEGVSVKKRRGLGEAAAKCVADVVDRRYVGYPEEPTVGATLVVTITKKKK
jgi:hypothetical protein